MVEILLKMPEEITAGPTASRDTAATSYASSEWNRRAEKWEWESTSNLIATKSHVRC